MLFADLLLRGVQSYYLRTLKLQKMSIHSYKYINWRTHNKLEKNKLEHTSFQDKILFRLHSIDLSWIVYTYLFMM